ncbi:MAG: HEPN domain-containing protein [Nitrospirae bacterium]|nr:HEPN domain-containing protein [Nitrospirota bacterium]
MTDRKVLLSFRIREETLADAERMLANGFSPRSPSNRAYYAMFYAVLALFLKSGINLQTSKHAGVISIFDKEFVHTGKLDTRLSKLLHKTFEARQTIDYKELVDVSSQEAAVHVEGAREFVSSIKNFVSV